jgi:hypothetical protein
MLYVRYVHLTKAKHIPNRQTHFLFKEDVTSGLLPQLFSWKNISGRGSLKGVVAKMNRLAVNCQL